MQQGQASMNEAQAQQLLQNIRGNPQIFNSLPQTLKDRVMDNDPRVLEEIIKYIILPCTYLLVAVESRSHSFLSLLEAIRPYESWAQNYAAAKQHLTIEDALTTWLNQSPQ